MHYVLVYDLAGDYLDRRAQFRSAHLDLAWQASDRGDLLLAGALSNPADRAMLLFTSAAAAESFAKADPYVANGLVLSWTVREWTTVAGPLAANPVRPAAL